MTSSSVLSDPLFDRKFDVITEGIDPFVIKKLRILSKENVITITNFLLAINTESNPSKGYRQQLLLRLCELSKFVNNKEFRQITREDLIQYMEKFRKPESVDPLHKWIGTYNLFLILLVKFFRWLFYPDLEPKNRPRPEVIENIPQLKRKEKSIYKPSDLWTPEDDAIFLKYCGSKRASCYHTIIRDTGCRPHEILRLKLKDIAFKSEGDRQYAEIVVNGKTGTRPLPLIDSLPYLKDYLLNEHPQQGNPNAALIAGNGKSLGRPINVISLEGIYGHYKKSVFPKLLDNPTAIPEDKQKIKELLKKPFSPYLVGRHTSLTQKSKILKESTLRAFAGWSTNSGMPQRYIHYFGNEGCESILQAYGILPKSQMPNTLKTKLCPNCNEGNKPDSKFCAKCRMVLTYDAYSETIEEKQRKDKDVESLREDITLLKEAISDMQQLLKNPKKLVEIIEISSQKVS